MYAHRLDITKVASLLKKKGEKKMIIETKQEMSCAMQYQIIYTY